MEVAVILGVHKITLMSWEMGHHSPNIWMSNVEVLSHLPVGAASTVG